MLGELLCHLCGYTRQISSGIFFVVDFFFFHIFLLHFDEQKKNDVAVVVVVDAIAVVDFVGRSFRLFCAYAHIFVRQII